MEAPTARGFTSTTGLPSASASLVAALAPSWLVLYHISGICPAEPDSPGGKMIYQINMEIKILPSSIGWSSYRTETELDPGSGKYFGN